MTAAEGTAPRFDLRRRWQAVEDVKAGMGRPMVVARGLDEKIDRAYDGLARLEQLAEAAERLEASVTPLLGTMNFYFGPGARTAVSQEKVKAYREMALAVKDTAAALAAVRSGRGDPE